jgi:proteasome lid subunit RPN8/RPN11
MQDAGDSMLPTGGVSAAEQPAAGAPGGRVLGEFSGSGALRPWAAALGGVDPRGPLHRPEAAPVLELPDSAAGGLCAAARLAWPQEACGLLLGSALGSAGPPAGAAEDGAPATRVVLALPTRNATLEVARDRYEVHPEDFLAADDRARELGLEIVGVWHSHPDSGPIPSQMDFERSWPGWSYLICGWDAGGPDVTPQLRSWRRLAEGAPFVEERLVTRR